MGRAGAVKSQWESLEPAGRVRGQTSLSDQLGPAVKQLLVLELGEQDFESRAVGRSILVCGSGQGQQAWAAPGREAAEACPGVTKTAGPVAHEGHGWVAEERSQPLCKGHAVPGP